MNESLKGEDVQGHTYDSVMSDMCPQGAIREPYGSAVGPDDTEIEPVSPNYVQDVRRGCPRSRLAAGLNLTYSN